MRPQCHELLFPYDDLNHSANRFVSQFRHIHRDSTFDHRFVRAALRLSDQTARNGEQRYRLLILACRLKSLHPRMSLHVYSDAFIVHKFHIHHMYRSHVPLTCTPLNRSFQISTLPPPPELDLPVSPRRLRHRQRKRLRPNPIFQPDVIA